MLLSYKYLKKRINEKGAATLLVVSVLTIVFVMLSITMARTNLIRFKTYETVKNSRHSYYLAETGIEETMYQLFEDDEYPGNPSGEVTPIGTFYIDIARFGKNDAIIYSYALERGTKRSLSLDVKLLYDLPDVVHKATYMSDYFEIEGEGSHIRGDIWTNDDFNVGAYALVEGNLVAAGKGSHAVNWVYDGKKKGGSDDGGMLVDNPDTEEVTEGNILAFDDVQVVGSGSYVLGDITSNGEILVAYGGLVDGVVTEYADTVWENVAVPIFDFETYEQQAIAMGTYYANHNSFENYLDSLDDGNERRLPESLYYVRNGNVMINGDTPVYLDGLLVVEKNLDILCEWHGTADVGSLNIIAGKTIYLETSDGSSGGDIRITGLVFSDQRIHLKGASENNDIYVKGAVWAADDVFVEDYTYIEYDLDINDIDGFGFYTGNILGLQKNSWEETVD